MNDIYKQLGFILENDYGIKIYIGTKGQSDWCIEIPSNICKLKCLGYISKKNDILCHISEETALEIATECNEIMIHNTIQENRIGKSNGTTDYKSKYFMRTCRKNSKNTVWFKLIRCPYCDVRRDVSLTQKRCKCPNCKNWFYIR